MNYGGYSHFHQYLSFIVEVSFLGGCNQSIRGKLPRLIGMRTHNVIGDMQGLHTITATAIELM